MNPEECAGLRFSFFKSGDFSVRLAKFSDQNPFAPNGNVHAAVEPCIPDKPYSLNPTFSTTKS